MIIIFGFLFVFSPCLIIFLFILGHMLYVANIIEVMYAFFFLSKY